LMMANGEGDDDCFRASGDTPTFAAASKTT
jgi:hypothetical protein